MLVAEAGDGVGAVLAAGAGDLDLVAVDEAVAGRADLDAAVAAPAVAGDHAVEVEAALLDLLLLPAAERRGALGVVEHELVAVDGGDAVAPVERAGRAELDDVAVDQPGRLAGGDDDLALDAVGVGAELQAGDDALRRRRGVGERPHLLERRQRQQQLTLGAADDAGRALAVDLRERAVGGEGEADRGDPAVGRDRQHQPGVGAQQLARAAVVDDPLLLQVVAGRGRSAGDGHAAQLERAAGDARDDPRHRRRVRRRRRLEQQLILRVEQALVAGAQRDVLDPPAAAVVGEDVPRVPVVLVGRHEHDREPPVLQVLDERQLEGRLAEQLVGGVPEVEGVDAPERLAADLDRGARPVPLAAAAEPDLQSGHQPIADAVEHEAVDQQGAALRLAKHVEAGEGRHQLDRRRRRGVARAVERAQHLKPGPGGVGEALALERHHRRVVLGLVGQLERPPIFPPGALARRRVEVAVLEAVLLDAVPQPAIAVGGHEDHLALVQDGADVPDLRLCEQHAVYPREAPVQQSTPIRVNPPPIPSARGMLVVVSRAECSFWLRARTRRTHEDRAAMWRQRAP